MPGPAASPYDESDETMVLSAPAEREHLHTRTVTCQGFRRRDGLWDIEGRMTDVKTYGFDNDFRGTIHPGDPLHDMTLRLTVDDELTITAVDATTDKAPYAICPQITPNFQKLVGLKIKGGFTRMVRTRLGGVHGCTHLVELLGPMATTAFQTIYPILVKERAERTAREKAANAAAPATSSPTAADGTETPPARKPPTLLNSCHAYASNGPLVKKLWPEFYTGEPDAAEAGAEGSGQDTAREKSGASS